MLVAHAVSTLLTVAVWWLCQRAAYAVVSVLDDVARPTSAGRRDRRLTGRTRAVRPALVHLVGVPRRGPPAAPCCA